MSSRELAIATSVDDAADKIASYLPGDHLWAAKRIAGSTLRALLRGLGRELSRFEQLINSFTREYDPRTTTQLLTEWETAVGLPAIGIDPTRFSLVQRRGLIVTFLSSTFQTQADFSRLATLIGVPISFVTGAQAQGLPWTLPATLSAAINQKFVLAVRVNRTAPPSLAGMTVITPEVHAAATDAPYDEKALATLILALLQAECILQLSYT